jgi:hypothetical protein
MKTTVTLTPGVVRNRGRYRAGRDTRGDPNRDVLSRLAGVTRATREPRRAGDPGLTGIKGIGIALLRTTLIFCGKSTLRYPITHC